MSWEAKNNPNNFKTESWERKWLLQILKTDFKTNTLIAYDVVAKKIRLQINEPWFVFGVRKK